MLASLVMQSHTLIISYADSDSLVPERSRRRSIRKPHIPDNRFNSDGRANQNINNFSGSRNLSP